jgi:hypothetical protein
MKYENAKDILPGELLKEIQKYAAGKLLYVPSGDEKKNWGEASGYRDKLKKRNLMICNKYSNGNTISEIADEYFLSLDTVKKIVYSKKKDKDLEYSPTLKSAVTYTNAGMMEEWIHSFLLFTCNNAELSDDLMQGEYIYFGVAKLPLRLVQTDDSMTNDVNKLIETYGRNASDIPPLLIKFEGGKFYVDEQKELFVSLKRRKINAYPSIIMIKGYSDYKTFMKHYGSNLIFVDKS